jgi:hypothetical protein
MDCFDRDGEAALLWRLFERGRNVLMLAPRRTGKTVLLERLRNASAGNGYHGILLDVEGFTEEKAFFRQLCASIQEEIGIGKSLLGSVGARLKQVVLGTEIPAEDWRNLLLQVEWDVFAGHLLAQLEDGKDGHDWLFLVDEITIFVNELLNRHGADRAAGFLYSLRRLQRSHPKVRWLLTGSIGLDTLARRHGFEGALVDLEIFSLGPFGRSIAADFVRHLAARERCDLPPEVVEALLDRLGWLSPYYLQKLTESTCEKGRGAAGLSHLHQALEEMLGVSRRTYWATWREHLDKNFAEPERGRLFAILEALCQSPSGALFGTLLLALDATGYRSGEKDLRDALDSLEADGYLEADAERTRFRFRMDLLREWWARYVASPARTER